MLATIGFITATFLLERNLRRAIYYRGARGITTTEQGAELARQFKLAMRELDYGSDEIAARQGIVTSRIEIGTLATSGSFGLARAIDEFLAQARGAGVHIVEPHHASLPGLRTLVRFGQETPNRARFDGLTRPHAFAHHHQRPADLADEAPGAP